VLLGQFGRSNGERLLGLRFRRGASPEWGRYPRCSRGSEVGWDGKEGGLLRGWNVLTESRGGSGETCREDQKCLVGCRTIRLNVCTRLVVVQQIAEEVARQFHSGC